MDNGIVNSRNLSHTQLYPIQKKNQAITTATYVYSQFNYLISSCLITIEHRQVRGISIILPQNLLWRFQASPMRPCHSLVRTRLRKARHCVRQIESVL